MKIWTVVTDDRNGHECRVYFTEAEADAAALEACRKDWPKDEGPCPANWRDAMEVIEQGDGLLMWVEEHDISGHPDLAPDASPQTPLARLDALALSFMATRPDLPVMSLDEFLAKHHDRLSPDERAAGEAILALHNAATWEA